MKSPADHAIEATAVRDAPGTAWRGQQNFSAGLSARSGGRRIIMGKGWRMQQKRRADEPDDLVGRVLETVSKTDLLRLKVIARLHARGLPAGIGWTDLLHEAIVRVLDGSRKAPSGLSMVAFLAGVMRSIRAEHWRRLRRDARTFVADAGEERDPAPDPERSLAASEALAALDRMFADDPLALQVIEGLGEGLSAEEIRKAYAMSQTDYDSTRKRMRRALLRDGLAWRRP
jgi:RNA polymerase sigma-70 factor (ECF subfamily)